MGRPRKIDLPSGGGIEFPDNSEEEAQPIVQVKDFKDVMSNEVALEAFMNEVLTIEIAPTSNENEPPYAHINVNTFNQIIPRGTPVQVKRKYVEVLARMKETKYTQHTPNPSEPDRIEMKERSGLVFPFQVLEDRNRKGHEWLAHIRSERN